MLLGLTTAQKFGLAGVAFVFVAFSLLSALVIPRRRPDFPGRRRLGLFVAVVIVLFLSMLGAVEVFARESEEEEPERAEAAETGESEEAGPTTTAGEGTETRLENPADPSRLRFSKSSLAAPAGTVTLVMENPSSLEHNISVKGDGVDEKGAVVGQGESSEVTVELEPGEYEFYCSVSGHEAAGMKGTLTVSG